MSNLIMIMINIPDVVFIILIVEFIVVILGFWIAKQYVEVRDKTFKSCAELHKNVIMIQNKNIFTKDKK